MNKSSLLHRIASIGSLCALAALVGIVYFAKRSPSPPRGAHRNVSSSPEESVFPAPGAPVVAPMIEEASPLFPEDETEFHPDPRAMEELDKRRGEVSRTQWDWWKRCLAQERDQKLRRLSTLLEISPECATAVRTYFEAEDSAWERDMEVRLQPTFEGCGAPSYEFMMGDPYRLRIAEITGLTNASVRSLLNEAQWLRYLEWRAEYNQGRFFISESK